MGAENIFIYTMYTMKYNEIIIILMPLIFFSKHPNSPQNVKQLYYEAHIKRFGIFLSMSYIIHLTAPPSCSIDVVRKGTTTNCHL